MCVYVSADRFETRATVDTNYIWLPSILNIKPNVDDLFNKFIENRATRTTMEWQLPVNGGKGDIIDHDPRPCTAMLTSTYSVWIEQPEVSDAFRKLLVGACLRIYIYTCVPLSEC